MPREQFSRRVWSLRDTWSERRKLLMLGTGHTKEAQFEVLLMLHRWTLESVADIRTVYGDGFDIITGPPPSLDQYPSAYSVTIAGAHNLTVSLTQRRKGEDAPWYVHFNVEGGHPAGAELGASNSVRGRLQDALLSVLGAYERSR